MMGKVAASGIIQVPGAEFDALKESVKQDIHCACPGIIQSYNAIDQTVTVELAIRSLMDGKSVSPPLLTDVPVFFPGGAASALTFPLQQGDECLVVFSDCCIDAWFQNGGSSIPISVRKHDLSDGFAFAGFRSKKNSIDNVEEHYAVTRKMMLDLTYPIGAIYSSTVETDPSELFGGVWDPIPGNLAYSWARVG